MGGVCNPLEENEQIKEYEHLLKEQEKEKNKLKEKLHREKEKQKQLLDLNRNYPQKQKDKIEKLTNEKKTIQKKMMKERKNLNKLQDEISECKKEVQDLQGKVVILKETKKKYALQAALITVTIPVDKDKDRDRDNDDDNNINKRPSSKSILANIPIPSFSFGNKPKPVPPPFKVKAKNNPNNQPKQNTNRLSVAFSDNDVTTDASSADDMDDDDDAIMNSPSTIILDQQIDPETEATHVYSWLYSQKIQTKSDKKQLKTRLASLLTSRSQHYRQNLIVAYKSQYNGRDLFRDIKAIITKGHAIHIIKSLLLTSSQLDAILISQCVANWDLTTISDIICCRTILQLKELTEAYKKKCKLDIRIQLKALAQKDKKNTLMKVIDNIFDPNRKEKTRVDINKVNEDLNFMFTTKSFKNNTKERLVLLFTGNSTQYIGVLNAQFKLKSKDSLLTFIDKKLGKRSIAGNYCKTRIQYALDSCEYFCKKIKSFGGNFKKNQQKLADVFIQRLEVDLDEIQRHWENNKFGENNRSLKEWVKWKSSNSKSGYFLQKMCDNCGRYSKFNKDQNTGKRKSKIERMMMT